MSWGSSGSSATWRRTLGSTGCGSDIRVRSTWTPPGSPSGRGGCSPAPTGRVCPRRCSKCSSEALGGAASAPRRGGGGVPHVELLAVDEHPDDRLRAGGRRGLGGADDPLLPRGISDRSPSISRTTMCSAAVFTARPVMFGVIRAEARVRLIHTRRFTADRRRAPGELCCARSSSSSRACAQRSPATPTSTGALAYNHDPVPPRRRLGRRVPWSPVAAEAPTPSAARRRTQVARPAWPSPAPQVNRYSALWSPVTTAGNEDTMTIAPQLHIGLVLSGWSPVAGLWQRWAPARLMVPARGHRHLQ